MRSAEQWVAVVKVTFGGSTIATALAISSMDGKSHRTLMTWASVVDAKALPATAAIMTFFACTRKAVGVLVPW
jgi:hypothetical protein